MKSLPDLAGRVTGRFCVGHVDKKSKKKVEGCKMLTQFPFNAVSFPNCTFVLRTNILRLPFVLTKQGYQTSLAA